MSGPEKKLSVLHHQRAIKSAKIRFSYTEPTLVIYDGSVYENNLIPKYWTKFNIKNQSPRHLREFSDYKQILLLDIFRKSSFSAISNEILAFPFDAHTEGQTSIEELEWLNSYLNHYKMIFEERDLKHLFYSDYKNVQFLWEPDRIFFENWILSILDSRIITRKIEGSFSNFIIIDEKNSPITNNL